MPVHVTKLPGKNSPQLVERQGMGEALCLCDWCCNSPNISPPFCIKITGLDLEKGYFMFNIVMV